MGANSFVNFPTISAGSRGPQAAIDLAALVPSTGLDDDLTFVLSSGNFVGDIAVEGSIDGAVWSTLCQFDVAVDETSTDVAGTSGTKTQSPILVEDTVVRFLRLNVSGAATVLSPTVVTVAAEANCGCAGPGTNKFITLPLIPKGSSGAQAAVDLTLLATPAGLDSQMTFLCTGTFQGDISVQGSSDGNVWSVLCQFDASSAAGAGGLLSPIQVTSVVRFLKVFVGSVVTSDVTISVAAETSCNCTTTCSGVNSFLPFPTINLGATGPQTAIDLTVLVPSTGLGSELTFVCSGLFRGTVAVEGSTDGTDWSNLCQFSSSPIGTTSASFSPVQVEGTIVRFLRANISGTVDSVVSVSVSGQKNCACAGGAGCQPVGLHNDGTQGTFTLAGASTDPLILGQLSYDFSCSKNSTINLAGTVDSQKSITDAGNVFPTYGIFIVTVVPPASELFSLITPDVLISTTEPVDHLFHTFTGTNTIVNPGAPRIVVFAVEPDSTGTDIVVPATYNYKNFILDVT